MNQRQPRGGRDRWRAASQAPGEPADLTEPLRSDAVIDLIATRRLTHPDTYADSAVSMLASLAVDVDAAPQRARITAAGHRAAQRGTDQHWAAQRGTAHLSPAGEAGDSPHGPGGWLDAAAAMVIMALSAAVAAGLVAAGMFTRLGQAAGSPRRRRAGHQGWPRR